MKLSRAKMTLIGSFLLLLVVAAAFIPTFLNSSAVTKTEAAGVNATGIRWQITSSSIPYYNFIRLIRTATGNTYAYGNTRVLPTAPDLLQVTLVNTFSNSSNNAIRLYIEENNMYIVGWDTGAGTNFYYLSDMNPPIPAGGHGIKLPFTSQYGDLQRVGNVSRQGQTMGYQSFVNSVSALANYNGSGSTASVARALIQLAQGVSEAARNYDIAAEIIANWGAAGYAMTAQDLAYENSWSAMGSALLTSLSTGKPPSLTVGNKKYATVAALAAVLALILPLTDI